MTWTYTISALGTSPLFQLRSIIGDVVEAAPQFQDEELAVFLGASPTLDSVNGAAVTALRALANRYSRSADRAAGNTSIKYSQIAKAYTVQANALARSGQSTFAAMPYAGGISKTDKLNQVFNTDRVQPQFELDMDDNYIPAGSNENNSFPVGSGE